MTDDQSINCRFANSERYSYLCNILIDPLSGINPDRRGPLRNTMTAINITH